MISLGLFLEIQNDRHGFVADAHAVDAHVDELEEVLAGADAAAALYLALITDFVHEDLDDFRRGALELVARQEARARLDDDQPTQVARRPANCSISFCAKDIFLTVPPAS